MLKFTKVFLITILASFCFIGTVNADETHKKNEYVDIPDSNLRDQILYELDKEEGSSVNKQEMTKITGDSDSKKNSFETTHVIHYVKNRSTGSSYEFEVKNELDLSNKSIKNLEGIQYLKDVEAIDLSGNKIEDLSPLAEIEGLKYLNLEGNNISDLSPLISNDLEALNLNLNKVQDVTELANVKTLKQLDLSHNQLTEIDTLNEIEDLEVLIANHNDIQELPKFSNTNLLSLTVSNNKLSSLKNVKDLNNLQVLSARQNNIKMIDYLKDMDSLKKVFLSNNPIDDNNQRNIDAHDYLLYYLEKKGGRYKFSLTGLDDTITNPIYDEEKEETDKDKSKDEQETSKLGKTINSDAIAEYKQKQKEKREKQEQKEKQKKKEQQSQDKDSSDEDSDGGFFSMIWSILKVIMFIGIVLLVLAAGFVGFLYVKSKMTNK